MYPQIKIFFYQVITRNKKGQNINFCEIQIENLHGLICLQDVETTTRKLSEFDGRVEVACEKKM